MTNDNELMNMYEHLMPLDTRNRSICRPKHTTNWQCQTHQRH